VDYTANWKNGKWFFSPAVSIDAGRDSAAKVAERNAGLRSEDSIFAEDGEDAHEQKEIIARETRDTLQTAQEIAKETGVDLPFVLTLLSGRTANGFLMGTPGLDGESAAAQAQANIDKASGAADSGGDGGDAGEGSDMAMDHGRRTQIRSMIEAARRRPSVERVLQPTIILSSDRKEEQKPQHSAEAHALALRELVLNAKSRRERIAKLSGGNS
jgi:hypothetical protein